MLSGRAPMRSAALAGDALLRFFRGGISSNRQRPSSALRGNKRLNDVDA
jgi:hypothetical protein